MLMTMTRPPNPLRNPNKKNDFLIPEERILLALLVSREFWGTLSIGLQGEDQKGEMVGSASLHQFPLGLFTTQGLDMGFFIL